MEVTFYGVRGSTPCSCPSTAGVGGNTSCVVVQAPDTNPILLDLGTGLRYFGLDWAEANAGQTFSALALVSHLHWDHVQGMPFFHPILTDGAQLDVVAPPQGERDLHEVFDSFLQPPMFPVKLGDLPGSIRFSSKQSGSFSYGAVNVSIMAVQHAGATNGYRIDDPRTGASIGYVSDHQQPTGNASHVDPAVLELCRGVDLLIHDAQYDDAEFALKSTWGHSTIGYAVEVAKQCEAKRLCLFHHDPSHDDEWIARAVVEASALAGPDIIVTAATERESITL